MERLLDRVDIKTGFAARVKGTNKWLRNKWSGGAQTGTNVQSLTNDRTVMSISSKAEIECYCRWYNKHHKVPVEFEIVEVELTTKTTVDFVIKGV
jgi:hypothetical protein